MKDISQGGVYVQSMTVLSVGTEVQLKMSVEGVQLEIPGVVSTSHALVGMGIAFQAVTGEQQLKLELALHALKTAPLLGADDGAPELSAADRVANNQLINSSPDLHSITGLIHACRTLTGGFDQWRSDFSSQQIEAFRQALDELQDRLALAAFEEMTVAEPALSNASPSCV
jgi:hypothetical protein